MMVNVFEKLLKLATSRILQLGLLLLLAISTSQITKVITIPALNSITYTFDNEDISSMLTDKLAF